MKSLSLNVLAFPALLLALGGTGSSAQSSWPPDDDNPPYVQQPGYPQQGYGQEQAYGQPTYPQQGYGYNQTPAYPQPQPLNPEQLDQIVAPVALYPDALLAQILTAST